MLRPMAIVLLGGAVCLAQVESPPRGLLAAEGLLARGLYDLAQREFDEFLAGNPRADLKLRANYGRALCAYYLRDYPRTEELLAGAVGEKTFPRRDEALALLTTVQLTRGNAAAAADTAAILLKEYPNSPQVEAASINRAQALYRLGKYEDSLAQVAAMLRAFPKSPQRAAGLYVGALNQRALQNPAAALTLLREVVRDYPTAPFLLDAQLMIGELLAETGKTDEAVTHLKKVEADAPESRKGAVAVALGSALARAGKYAEAVQTFDSVILSTKDQAYVGQARLQKGIALLKANQRAKARQVLALVVQEHTALAPSARYWLARCDLLENNFTAARDTLTALAQAKPAPPEVAEVHFDLAFCALRLGDYPAAATGFADFRLAWPYSPHVRESYYYQALALNQLGKFAESITLCQEAAKGADASSARSACLLQAENHMMLRQFTQAAKVLEGLEPQAAGGERLRVLLRLGQVAYFQGDHGSAEKYLHAALKVDAADDPLRDQAQFFLGDVQLQQRKYAEAVESFKQTVAAGKVHPQEAMYKLALAQLGARDRKAAEETLAELRREKIDSPWGQRAWLQTAQLAYDDGKYKDAAAVLENLRGAKMPAEVAAPTLYLTAQIIMAGGMEGDAVVTLSKLIDEYPQHELAEDAMYARGVALARTGKWADALARFNEYLKAYPRGRLVPEAWHQGARCMVMLGRYEQGIKILQRLADEPTTRNEAVVYSLASAQSFRDAKAGIAAFEEYLKEYPTGGRRNDARIELSDLLARTGRQQDAAAQLTAALQDERITPALRATALRRLGECYLRLKEPAKAAAVLDRYTSAQTEPAKVVEGLCKAGTAYLQSGDTATAKRRFQQAIDHAKPASSLALVRFAEAQNQAGEYDAAARGMETFLRERPKDPLAAQAYLALGWSLENRSQYEAARDAYQKAIALDTGATGARAQFQVGETYFAQKQFDAAAKELLKVDILYQAPEWAARGLYEAGRAFEQLKQPQRAKQQFEELLKKYPESDVAALARKRMEKL